MATRNPLPIVAFLLAACGISGCAPWGKLPSRIPDVRPARLERAADVINSFERHRDEAEFSAAQSFLRQGNREQCRTTLESLVHRSPSHGAGQALLMKVLLVEGQVDRAEQIADGAAEFDEAQVWHARGLVYDAVDRHEEAWKCLEKSVELEPRNEDYLASLKAAEESTPTATTGLAKTRAKSQLAPECILLTAEVCLALGRAEEARQRLEGLVSSGERESEVQGLLQRIAIAGRASAAKVAKSNAKNSSSRRTAADGAPLPFDVAGEAHPSGVTIMRTSAETETHPEVLTTDACLHQAGQALAEGHIETAATFLRKARELAPKDESVALSTSVLPLRHEEYELSRQLTEEVLARFPRSAPLYRVLGMAQYRLNRLSPARDALQHAIALDNRDALAYFLMGCTLNKLGQADLAQPYYRQAQQLDARYAQGSTLR